MEKYMKPLSKEELMKPISEDELVELCAKTNSCAWGAAMQGYGSDCSVLSGLHPYHPTSVGVWDWARKAYPAINNLPEDKRNELFDEVQIAMHHWDNAGYMNQEYAVHLVCRTIRRFIQLQEEHDNA